MKTTWVSIGLALLLTACSGGALKPVTTSSTQSLPQLKPVSFSELPSWQTDSVLDALKAFDGSCARILKSDPAKNFGKVIDLGTMSVWQTACAARPNIQTATNDTARNYFETYFSPYAVTVDGNEDGLFTGYFEASLNGSLIKSNQYSVPIRARPSDLVMVNLGEFRDELRGQRIAGRVVDGTLKPYQDRTQIELGKLPKDQDRALLYVDSAVEAFFLQIQGSGVVTLPDGTTRRVGFDGQNGHVYSAVGGELIRRGHLTKDTVSMQSIKSWMEQNPAEARDVMRTNKSYVFFRFIDGDHTVSGPIGGEGIPLTAERSIAIDSGIYPYGIPFFLDAEHPLDGQQRLQRLMIGQDTGGAIRGGVRGDYFWGHGNAAERAAGPMKSSGRFWILRPKS